MSEKGPDIPKPMTGRRVAREARRPFGSQMQRLAYEQRQGYHRHWFNENPGRIEEALAAGYTHVEDREGRKVNKVVGVDPAGRPLTAFLMEIPQEWYDDDMARQQRQVDEMDDSIRRGAVAGKPQVDGRYIPSRGITYTSGNRGST